MNTLRAAVDEYLEMRHALGYKLKDAGAALSTFISFLEKHGKSYITMKLALEWSMLPSGVSPHSWASRLSFVRGCARYRSATDPRTEVPPCGLLPWGNTRAKPYPYTDEEIRGLMDAALRLPPKDGLRPWTYYCLFGLLPVTGLRISEALSLQCSDVDLQEGILTIRRTKFEKSRLVPVHASTKQVLAEYAQRRDRFLCRQTSQFFLYLIVADRWRSVQCTKRFIRCPGRWACEVRSKAMVRVYMIFGTTSLVRHWCHGTGLVRMWIDVYLFCQRTSDTLASAVPTGIYRSVRS